MILKAIVRHFDHVDLRVPDLGAVRHFYCALLPQLGFTEDMNIRDWLQYSAKGEGPTEFFGVTQSPAHTPNENRIAFWAASEAAVNEIARLLSNMGARNIEGPSHEESEDYYAVFFEDPAGNRLEVCYRSKN